MSSTSKVGNIIVRWSDKDPAAQDGVSWYLRGIRPDGSFYGEVKKANGEEFTFVNVEGELSTKDNTELRELVSKLGEYDVEVTLHAGEYDGLVALGAMPKPCVILKFSCERHRNTEISHLFHRIIELIKGYLHDT